MAITKDTRSFHNGVFPMALGFCLAASLFLCRAENSVAQEAGDIKRPNILFISLDDLNDWIGCLGGHPQTITPNFDRLAKSSVLFTNAHCSAASCNPSRTAILTGISPHHSGIYDNGQPMRQLLPDAEIIPKTFSKQGYYSAGSGKILHYFIDAPSWDEYFPKAESENPFPRTLYPKKRPLSLPRAGAWQYVETDWGPLDATGQKYGGDYLVTQWISGQLRKIHDKPFFLACGINRPHEPWFVPKKYFEPFPLKSIQLPLGYRKDDLDDLPPEGKRRGPNRYFEYIRKQGQWKKAIQGYLASIHFADAMLGRVLDALKSGPNAQNTIVVLWSDHGWHLGEKNHWSKYTAWRVCTRIPLMIRVPQGVPGLRQGTTPSTCDRPVSLLSLYPTLLELAGLPAAPSLDGSSLVPLLRDPEAKWNHVAVTYLGDPGSYGLSARHWRLIHYANGDEELYNIKTDPHEWNNLAEDPKFQTKRNELRSLAPKSFQKKRTVDVSSLPTVEFHPSSASEKLPKSHPKGIPFALDFINKKGETVRLLWSTPDGQWRQQAKIAPEGQVSVRTRAGVVWLVVDNEMNRLGYFHVTRLSGKAVVPK